MAVIALATLFDPISWMPSVHQIWDDCDCALARRFPGVWWRRPQIFSLRRGRLRDTSN